ncbi:hypothetical protein [Clostridium butyricum]|uniref:hypothetical protein n=1 Tax=Clostridium butyricum TaxID=1492 RepID=UPI0018AA0F57|nr:hypothetical protein [Clostridium butyricum]
MNLENSIKDVIAKKLEDGTIEKLVSEQLESGVNAALKDLFGNYGDVTKIIKEKVKSVIVPYLESYDYSEYIVKLDDTLTSVLKETTMDNRKILGNFKELMSVKPDLKSVKVSDIFSKWCEYVEKNVETDGLEVEYDDGPHYEYVDVNYEFETGEERGWIKQENGRIIFECAHDENMNVCIDVYRWNDIHKEDMWSFSVNGECNLSSLRNLDEFKVYLMSLKQAGADIEIDKNYDSYDILPEKEPEATFE